MSDRDTPIEELSVEEIQEAMLTTPQPPANSLEESSEELKAMGIRDIKDVKNVEAVAMKEAMKNVQIQRTLDDFHRGSKDHRSAREYLERHLDFLVGLSPNKTKSDIVKNMTLEHATAVLKITAKMDVPKPLILKHLKTIKRKYKKH